MPGDQPIIIIKKKKSAHGGHHGGAWKVAYADFVTAMMAFFLVMWILGLSKPAREAIASYFNDPYGFMKSKGGKSPIGEGPKPDLIDGRAALAMPRLGGPGSPTVRARLKGVEDAIEKALARSPEFREMKDSVEIKLTSEGLRIELMEKTSALFFDSGSAHLKPRAVKLLAVIAKNLRDLDNPIVLEGHTDSQPFLGRDGYSNWELSSDRANAARRALQTSGMLPGQVVAVRGFADRKLRKPEDPFHFSNRRVSILVAYAEEKPENTEQDAEDSKMDLSEKPEADTHKAEEPAAGAAHESGSAH